MTSLYGIHTKHRDNLVTLVTACDTQKDFEQWIGELEYSGTNHTSFRSLDFMDKLKNKEIKDFKGSAFLVFHENEQQRKDFAKEHNVVIESLQNALERHEAMFETENEDNDEEEDGDDRSLAEIYSLDEEDPWDMRPPEVVEMHEQQEKMRKEAEKHGMTGPMETNDSGEVTVDKDTGNANVTANPKDSEDAEEGEDEGNSQTPDYDILTGSLDSSERVIYGKTANEVDKSKKKIDHTQLTPDDFKRAFAGDGSSAIFDFGNNETYEGKEVPENVKQKTTQELEKTYISLDVPQEIVDNDFAESFCKKVSEWAKYMCSSWIYMPDDKDTIIIENEDDARKIDLKMNRLKEQFLVEDEE